MNPIVNSIATTNLISNTIMGGGLIIPAIMALGSPKLKPSMLLIGLSGLSVIPCANIATVMTVVTCDLNYQFIHAVPYYGICVGTLIDSALNSIQEEFGPATDTSVPPATES